MILDSVFDAIGETPLIRLSRIDLQRIDPSRIDQSRIDPSRIDRQRIDRQRIDSSRIDPSRIDPSRIDQSRIDGAAAGRAEVLAKLELKNPGGSVKDRPARAMILGAEARGQLRPGSALVEATSGNTGISLAMLAAVRGYRCFVVMPEDMSLERRALLRAFGAEVVLTPKDLGMRGAVERAEELARTLPGAFHVRQFENPDNPAAHEETTAQELFRQTGGHIDVLVSGVGTGGTLTGTARALKKLIPKLRTVAVEPDRAAAFAGKPFRPHAIQGIGAGFVPSIVDRRVIDHVVAVDDAEALKCAVDLARTEGLLCGPSSGANVLVALAEARRLGPGGRVVTFLCDTGERYAW